MRSILSSRATVVVLFILLVYSIVCTQIPLFNYLGFEFSALTSVIAAFLIAILAIHQWKRGEGLTPPVVFFLRMSVVSVLLLFVPLAVMTANGLFVKNCSFMQGFMLFALIPLPAMLFSLSIAVLLSVVVKRWRKAAATVVLFLVLIQIVIETFTGPQIFSFNQIVGYFPGFTYDESLEIGSRLLIFRISTFVWILLLLNLAHLGWIRRHPSEDVSPAPSVRTMKRTDLVRFAGIIAALFLFWLFRFEAGLSSSIGSINDELGGTFESDHFIISYPKVKLSDEDVRELVDAHEFMLNRVSTELRTVVGRKIRSFIYESPEQKGRLIGAAGTNIAKPWLWQIHLNLGDVEHSLKHELVHVVAADFGFPLLRIGLNPGLIEGLAMAVERTAYDETLHELAARIFDVGIQLDMNSLFSFTGFAQTQPAISYVLAGSFSRYLIDQHGLRRFKRLYRTGDFKSGYNKELDRLVWEWRRYLNRFQITPEERSKAVYLFKRPTIFKKICPRVIASLNAEASRSLRRGDLNKTLSLSGRSLELAKSPAAVNLHATAMRRLGEDERCIQFLERVMRDSTIQHSLVHLNLLLGDSYWAVGQSERAKEAYERLLAVRLNSTYDEAASLRLLALSTQQSANAYQSYFAKHQADSSRITLLADLLTSQKHFPSVTHFLMGRELMSQKKYTQASKHLQQVKELNSAPLNYLLQYRLGRSFFAMRDYQRAKMHFRDALNFSTERFRILHVREWIQRCEWMYEKRREGPTAKLLEDKGFVRVH